MLNNKNERIKELEAVIVKLYRERGDLDKLVKALEMRKKNASSAEEIALIARELEQLELDRSKLYEEIGNLEDQLLILKYRGSNFKYFDLPLDEKIIDEHFKKVERAGGEWRSELWDQLLDYEYYTDNVSKAEAEDYDFSTNNIIKSRIKQPTLFYYSDPFDAYYIDYILALIKRVVKFRFVNGICNTLFYRSSGHPRHGGTFFNYELFRFPFITEDSFARYYALPLYHLVPKQSIIELHERYAKYKKEAEEGYFSSYYSVEDSFRKRKKRLSNGTIIDYYIYNCGIFEKYLVNFSAKYFAYNIARFLVKNVLFLPNKLSTDFFGNDFKLFFPDTFNLDIAVSRAIVRETIKHLNQIFASLDVFELNSATPFSGCRCSFSLGGRPFKFRIFVEGDSYYNFNYPYRSFYMPDCKESDEEFLNKVPLKDRVEELGYVNLENKNDTYYPDLYPFCWPLEQLAKELGHGPIMSTSYILSMAVSEIDYYNLEVKEPFSLERFKQQVEELRKKAAYNSFYDHYSFLIADTAFYQFEKYLEYELEQHKIRNNINYEQMLEERKEKENKFSFKVIG
jgi:hypothetical protein